MTPEQAIAVIDLLNLIHQVGVVLLGVACALVFAVSWRA